MQVKPRSMKEARGLQISLVVLQLDTQATVFQWHFLSCPARPTTQLGGTGKRMRNTGFPTSVLCCPWRTKCMLQEGRPRPLGPHPPVSEIT